MVRFGIKSNSMEKEKELRVEWVRMSGFRGLDVELVMGSEDIWVEGGNGVGKSTVLAGYRWCMSGYVDGVHGRHWGIYPRGVEGRCRVSVSVGVRVNGGGVVEVVRWGERDESGRGRYGVSVGGGEYGVWLWRELGVSEEMVRWLVGGDMLIGRSYVEGSEARKVLGVISGVGEGEIGGIIGYEGSGMTVSQVEAIERAVIRESEAKIGVGVGIRMPRVVCPRCGEVIEGGSSEAEEIDVRALGARIAEAKGIVERCKGIREASERGVEGWVEAASGGIVRYVGGGGERGMGMFFDAEGVPYGMVNASGRGDMEAAMLGAVCEGVGVVFPLVMDEGERWEAGVEPRYGGQRIIARVSEGELKSVKMFGGEGGK